MIVEPLRRRATLTMGAIALAGLSGCSLAFVEGPPANHASRHFFDCTSSLLAPGLDGALAATMALGLVGETSDGSHDSSSIVTSSALVVGALASATYGYIQVSHCRQAKEALAARLVDAPYLGVPQPAAPRALPGPDASARAPAPRDPWLSEGPPPQPYLPPAPQGPPPTVARPPGTMPPRPAPPAATPAPAPVEPPAPAEAGPSQ